MFLKILCVILTIIIIVLLFKIYLLKKSMDEICIEFRERLFIDTNTLISISSGDRHAKQLAAEINTQLRLLRNQRRLYLNGDRELKEAVTNISHDLRTPLTAICGYLDILEKEEKNENVTRYISYIKNRTQVLAQLTEELFRYTVIMSAEELQFETVDVNAVLEESLIAFYAALTERGIIPVVHMPETRILCYLDKSALSRVFSNILNNALKYSDGDLEVQLLDQGEIIFYNTARELDEVQVGKLFNRFFTVEAARDSTGLGLAISKALIEQMHGSITAQYDENQLKIHIVIPGKMNCN